MASNSAAEQSSTTIEDDNDTLMEEAVVSEGSQEYSDDEETWSDKDITSTDDNEDSEGDEAVHKFGPVNTSIELGVRLVHEFPDTEPYEDDEARDIFDDGLEDDDSDSGSDLSTNFEELSEPGTIIQIMEVSNKEVYESDSEMEENYDGTYHETTSSEEGEDEEEALSVPEVATSNSMQHSQTQYCMRSRSDDLPSISKKSLSELEKQHYQLLYQKTSKDGWRSLQQVTDTHLWHLLELEEIKRNLEEQISEAKQAIELAEKNQQKAEKTFTASLEDSGICQDLYDLYLAFCDSLDAQHGLREGFSIACDADHASSYTNYDPSFSLFKTFVEMPYTNCHFRCEGSYSTWGAREPIVHFWPVPPPEPLTGTETTWREQYPELYELAIVSARNGSKAAMDMLIALPDMDSKFGGGWLFDYRFEEALSNCLVEGKRWRFRSAHEIDKPCSVEEKKEKLQLMFSRLA